MPPADFTDTPATVLCPQGRRPRSRRLRRAGGKPRYFVPRGNRLFRDYKKSRLHQSQLGKLGTDVPRCSEILVTVFLAGPLRRGGRRRGRAGRGEAGWSHRRKDATAICTRDVPNLVRLREDVLDIGLNSSGRIQAFSP